LLAFGGGARPGRARTSPGDACKSLNTVYSWRARAWAVISGEGGRGGPGGRCATGAVLARAAPLLASLLYIVRPGAGEGFWESCLCIATSLSIVHKPFLAEQKKSQEPTQEPTDNYERTKKTPFSSQLREKSNKVCVSTDRVTKIYVTRLHLHLHLHLRLRHLPRQQRRNTCSLCVCFHAVVAGVVSVAFLPVVWILRVL
jgi:hypothetical protein